MKVFLILLKMVSAFVWGHVYDSRGKNASQILHIMTESGPEAALLKRYAAEFRNSGSHFTFTEYCLERFTKSLDQVRGEKDGSYSFQGFNIHP